MVVAEHEGRFDGDAHFSERLAEMAGPRGEMFDKARLVQGVTKDSDFFGERIFGNAGGVAPAAEWVIEELAGAIFARQIKIADSGDLRRQSIGGDVWSEPIRGIEGVGEEKENAAVAFLIFNHAAEVVHFIFRKLGAVGGAFDNTLPTEF